MVSGAEFLLSMVETHWYSRNGDARKMEVRLKAEQELTRIEEHGVWVEFLQEARYGTLVEGLLGGEGIGCVRLEDGVSVNYGPDLRIEVVRRPQVDGSAQQDGGEPKQNL